MNMIGIAAKNGHSNDSSWLLMIKYLTESQIVYQLNASRSIEQWLKSYYIGNAHCIKFIRITNDLQQGCCVWISEVEDVGDDDHLDIYSFPAIDPDAPYGHSVEFKTIKDCLQYCYTNLDAKPEKFVGAGLLQDLYRNDYLNRNLK